MGVLAGVYLALVCILAVRNPKTEPEPASVSGSVTETISSSENPGQKDTPEWNPAGDAPGTEQTKDSETNNNSSALDEYGRGRKRYTEMGAQEVFSKVNVTVTNAEELENIVGVSADTVKSYLNTYASRGGIDAEECTVLDHVYVGFLSERIEIYMQYNDINKSLVTVIYEPANASHSSHVDVLPCQYTLKEIQKKAWK